MRTGQEHSSNTCRWWGGSSRQRPDERSWRPNWGACTSTCEWQGIIERSRSVLQKMVIWTGARREGGWPLRGSCNHLGYTGQMNERTDKWMIVETSSSDNFCWSFYSQEKGKWLSYPFQLLSPPPPPAFMNGFSLARMCISSSNAGILELQSGWLVLVIFKQFFLGGKCSNQLNQNSQGSWAETRNTQSGCSSDQNSHQLEKFWDCSVHRRVKMRMLRSGKAW